MRSITQHFREVAAIQGTVGPICEVISWLALDDPPLDGFERLVEKHGVRRASWFRRQVMDLTLEYIARARQHRPMSEEQLLQIELLKEALHVREGELRAYRPAELAALLNEEVAAALEDGLFDDTDDVHLVRLQIAFDLGYDDLLRLCRAAIERGMQTLIDEAARQTDHDRLADVEMKIANLAPFARLAMLQKRSLGALH